MAKRASVQAIQREWLPALAKDRKAEAAAVRLKAYCTSGFLDPPDGLELLEDVEDVEQALEQRGGYESRSRGAQAGRGGGRGGYGRRR